MSALSLDIAANTRQAQAQVKDLGKALETVSDELTDVAKDGARQGEKLEDVFREISRAAKTEGKDAGDGLKKGIKSGLDDAKDETKSSGKEAAASFSGGFEDVADFVQEVLANAFEGFGPIGAAAGIALAAVLGTILSNAQATQEKLNDARGAAKELATEMYENGGELPLETAIDNLFDKLAQEVKPNGPIQSMIDAFVDFGSRVDGVKKSASDLGLPLKNVAKALSGTDMAESERVLKAVNEKLAEMKSNVGTAWVWQTGPLEDMKTQLEATIEGARLADESLSVVGSGFDSQAVRDKIREIGEAWQDNATDAADYITETEGVTSFDWSAYLTNAETTLAAANEYKRQIVGLPDTIQTEAESIFAEQGAVAANSYITAYTTASANDQARFVAAADANGAAAGKAGGEALTRAADLQTSKWTPPQMKLRLDLDDSAIQNYRPPTKTGNVRYLPQAV